MTTGTRRYEILYEAAPAWRVGETKEARVARRRTGTPVAPEDRYPDRYPGRVISVRAVRDVAQKRLPSLRNMASKDCPVVVRDLNDEERQGLASRRQKIVFTAETTESTEDGSPRGTPLSVGSVPSVVKTAVVTFDDRHGAVAATLRRQFPGDGVAEAAEARADDPFDVEGRRFAEVASLARGFLPKTVTHTGTDLYAAKVTPTKNDDTLKALQENLLQPSEDFTTSWTETRAVAIGDQTVAPDGLTTADKIDELAVVGTHGVYRMLTFTNVAHTFSVYLKAGERSWGLINIYDAVNGSCGRYFDLANGVVGGVYSQAPTDSGIEDVGGGWYRCWIVATPAAASGNCAVYTAAGDGQGTYLGVVDQGIYAWGAQLNRGSGPAAYRVTTGSPLDPNGVDLTTGGLGTADAFKGGYVTNVTRSELRAIVSHTDGAVTLEGDLSTWAETDDLDVYDAWSAVQAVATQLFTDQGAANFTAEQTLRIHEGTFNELVDLPSGLRPTAEFRLIIEGTSRTQSIVSGAGLSGYTFDVNLVDSVLMRTLTIVESDSDRGLMAIGSNSIIRSCTLADGMTGGYAINFASADGLAEDCTIGGVSQTRGFFQRCIFSGGNVGAYQTAPIGFEGCVFSSCFVNLVPAPNPVAPGSSYPTVFMNCTFYNWSAGIVATSTYVRANLKIRNCIFDDVVTPFILGNVGAIDSDRNCFHGHTQVATVDGVDKTLAEWQALTDDAGNSPDANSIEADPLLTDPANGDFSLGTSSPCRNAGAGSAVATGIKGVALDPNHPDIGAWSSGVVNAPARPMVSVSGASGATVTAFTTGEADATHRVDLVRISTGAVADYAERSGAGEITLTAPELSAGYAVVATCSNAAGRSLPSAPASVFVSEGDGPFEELRAGIVSRLAAHSTVAAVLGTDDSGAVPIYASHPASARVVPVMVYTLSGTPEDALDRPGRWTVELALESWSGSTAVNDSLVSAADEALHASPFEGTDWAVKRIARTGDAVRWETDGGIEVRRTTWSIAVDRIGS